jgi:hypothetical protein
MAERSETAPYVRAVDWLRGSTVREDALQRYLRKLVFRYDKTIQDSIFSAYFPFVN